MDGIEPTTVDITKEYNNMDSDAMMVEETQNSSSFTQLTEVIVIFFLYTYFHMAIFKVYFDKCCNFVDHVECRDGFCQYSKRSHHPRPRANVVGKDS
jgi:hypothetical protein